MSKSSASDTRVITYTLSAPIVVIVAFIAAGVVGGSQLLEPLAALSLPITLLAVVIGIWIDVKRAKRRTRKAVRLS